LARIRIAWATGEVTAHLHDSPTARRILSALPCRSQANTWGEEVYFSVPVTADLEADAKQVVPPGTICFWVDGSALALPYGPTPVSQGSECRLVSPCNVVGKIEGDPRVLDTVRAGEAVRVEVIPD